MENLKTVSALVKNILEHDHKARNTDNHLYLMVLEHYSGCLLYTSAVPMGEITRALAGVRRRLCVKWGFVDMDVYEQEYRFCYFTRCPVSYTHLFSLDSTSLSEYSNTIKR